MKQVLLLTLMLVLLAGCSSTPEDTHHQSQGRDFETVPGCEHAQNPEECRREHRRSGSDVPTVDHATPGKP